MGYISMNEMLTRLMAENAEAKRRQDSIDRYREELADQKPEERTGQPDFDPEPVITLSPETRKETALRRMLNDLKGVNW